jgi:hypothetical protein
MRAILLGLLTTEILTALCGLGEREHIISKATATVPVFLEEAPPAKKLNAILIVG